MADAEPRVMLRHCVGVDGRRYCAPGLRAFCTRHGFSLRELVSTGLPADAVAATGDAMATRAAALARAEAEHGGQPA